MKEDDKQYTLGMLKVWATELQQFIDAYDIGRNDIPSLKLLRIQREIQELANINERKENA